MIRAPSQFTFGSVGCLKLFDAFIERASLVGETLFKVSDSALELVDVDRRPRPGYCSDACPVLVLAISAWWWRCARDPRPKHMAAGVKWGDGRWRSRAGR